MIFNSLVYLFLFLPIAVGGYFCISRFFGANARNAWLILVSLFFYGFWNPIYVPLLSASIVANFLLGSVLLRGVAVRVGSIVLSPKTLLILGIGANLGLLGFFKYADFFITNVNWILSTEIPLVHVVLPLAISFFTFQQIAYIVDCKKGLIVQKYSLQKYAMFVTFFPHLIAGPILHHKDVLPQFEKPESGRVHSRAIALGLFLICLGLAKKVGIADTFAVWANAGYAYEGTLTFFDAWATSLAYTFQLYFDFSGYTDMATGSALLFNITLPRNFNSPYKATDIQDFWERWHITLTRWFREYLYFPLAWSWRGWGRLGSYFALFTTFVIVGLWHGGAWSFVALGALHGIAMIVHRFWKECVKITLPTPVGWFLTFNFVNVAWVLFRAESFPKAFAVLSSMVGVHGFGHGTVLFHTIEQYAFAKLHISTFLFFQREVVAWVLVCLCIVLLFRNSNELKERFSFTIPFAIAFIGLYAFGIMNLSGFSEFLYFNF